LFTKPQGGEDGDDGRVQRIRDEGQCGRPGGRRDHRRRLRAIVDSLVQDVIMPPIGKLFGGLDFASYYLPLNGQAYGLSAGRSEESRRRARLR
jgi:hypothetical protein